MESVSTRTAPVVEGRAAHQADVDGSTTAARCRRRPRWATCVRARVTGNAGVDLVAEHVEVVSPAGPAVMVGA